MIVIGGILVCCTFVSLVIGHYHHNNQYSDQILGQKLKQFMDDSPRPIRPIRNGASLTQTGDVRSKPDAMIHERTVFESIIQRTERTTEQCNGLAANERNTIKKQWTPASELTEPPPVGCKTDVSLLPELGVGKALGAWLEENPADQIRDYPTCYVPPPKSCNVTTYTLVIMSHTTERLPAFVDPVSEMIGAWPGLTEVIIVWNSPRETLNQAKDDKEKSYARKLLDWDADPSHPLRIFFSLENGLANNLLNRYHPSIEPKNEVVMFFDDDGPFWSRESMIDTGFELWKRNSDVQVGGFPRNIRFLSERMKTAENVNLKKSIDIIISDVPGYKEESHPPFTPVCRETSGDFVEYNYFSFPEFAGHVLLPSGTFLHRNFLCFVWHPAFEELRQWVVTHKTMPDDMTVSTLVSHLAGRAPRTFPREINTGHSRRLSENDSSHLDKVHNQVDASRSTLAEAFPHADRSHRRLLWKQKCWASWREDAINSILGYFGSIHPGSVGWCAGTKHQKPNSRGVPFICHPEKPSLHQIPWLNEDGTGSNQCPHDSKLREKIKEHKERHAREEVTLGDFCMECKYLQRFHNLWGSTRVHYEQSR